MCRLFNTILLLISMIATVEARLGADDTGDLQQYIIRFDHNADDLPQNREEIEQRAQQVASHFGGTVEHIYEHVFPGASIRNLPKSALILSSVTPEADDMSRIFQSNDIAIPSFWFEEDHVIKLSVTQDAAPPPLDRINQKSLPLDGVYDYAYDGSGVTVFVTDTGVKADHEEFSDISVTCGYNAVAEYEETCDDLYGHGSHVAGSIASRTYGVAKRVNIVSVKVFDESGFSEDSVIIAGVDFILAQKFAASNSPMVANLSLGGFFSWFINDAVNAAASAGVVMVVAAGNDDRDACINSPASAKSAITVGAAEPSSSTTLLSFLSKFLPLRSERRASFSNYGSCVDLFAWGVNIVSVGIDSTSAVATYSGTSMSAPHVAGAAALYLSRDPSLTPAQVKQLLIDDASKDQMMELVQKRSPNRLLNTENIV